MIVSHLKLQNWKNFQHVDVSLGSRMFLVGPNASGKSNFLDAFRFLRDIVKPGGGLQKALSDRGGLSKIKCLSAGMHPGVSIEIHLSEMYGKKPTWIYSLAVKPEVRGRHNAVIVHEKVWNKNEGYVLDRPNIDDEADKLQLTASHIEHLSTNKKFREIAKFFEAINYLHLIPQLLRHPEDFSRRSSAEDPFGGNFLEKVIDTNEKVQKSRMRKIEAALRWAVPQLKQLGVVKDDKGIPHLEAIYEHWRPNAGKQREDQFSDGTLRLIGLLWSLLDGESLLLLEEPELSLHAAIVSQMPGLIYRIQKQKGRQVFISSHSADLLSDEGIGGEEVLLLKPNREGTSIVVAKDIPEVKELLSTGMTAADAIMPRTTSENIGQLSFFE